MPNVLLLPLQQLQSPPTVPYNVSDNGDGGPTTRTRTRNWRHQKPRTTITAATAAAAARKSEGQADEEVTKRNSVSRKLSPRMSTTTRKACC